MAKVFDWDGRQGALIEKVSGVALTNTNGVFATSEKGLAWNGNDVDTAINLASSFTISKDSSTTEIWFKYNDALNTTSHLAGNANSNWNYIGRNNATVFKIEPNFNGGTWGQFNFANITLFKWHHLLFTAESETVKIYLDNLLLVTTAAVTYDLLFKNIGSDNAAGTDAGLNGSIGKFTVWDNVASTLERNKLYDDFLHSFPRGAKKVEPIAYSVNKEETIIDPTCVAAYTFKNGSVLDVAGTNHGTNYGAVPTVDGMRFDGVDDYVSCPTVSSWNFGTSDFTLALRIKYNGGGYLLATSTESVFLGGSKGGWDLIIAPTYVRWGVQYNNSWLDTWDYTFSPATGVFYDIVLTRSGNNWTKYINGVSVQTQTKSYTITSTQHLHIGADTRADNSAAMYLNSEIEEVRIYNTAKDQAWITAYHNKFARQLTARDTSLGEGVGNKSKEWNDGTGVHEIDELTTSPNASLPIGTQYRKFTTAGTVTMDVDLDEYVNNGFISYWMLESGTWSYYNHFADGGIAPIVYSSGILTATGANINDGFALVKITQGFTDVLDVDALTQYDRIITAGGMVTDFTWMNLVITTLKAQSIYTNCVFLGDANFGVEKDVVNAVATLYDISGNDDDATQGVGANQSIWTAGVQNGKYGIVYDGAGDRFDTPAIDGFPSKRGSIIIVSNNTLGTGSSTLLSTYPGAGTVWEVQTWVDTVKNKWYDGAISRLATVFDSATHTIQTIIRSGDTATDFYINGTVDSNWTVTDNQHSVNAITIGAQTDGNPSLTGNILTVFMIDVALTTTQRQALESLINNYYAIY